MTEITYPPLSEIRKNLRVRWYRCPVDRERLKALSTRTDRQGWIQAGGHIGLYLGLAAITVLFWLQQLWVAFFISLWCVGFVATFFKGTSAHELGHGTVFKTKVLNTWFLHLVSLISWWDPYDYGVSHTYHHRYTTHLQADRENVLPLTPSFAPTLIAQLLTLNLLSKPNRNFSKGGFIWNMYLTLRTALGLPAGHTDIASQEWLQKLHEDQPAAFRQSVNWSRALILFHSTILVTALYTGWWVLPLIISMPSFIANIGSYVLGTTQHCGLITSSSDFRKNTRSIKLNPVLGFLYWWMNFHTEHHMYAGVPCYNLKALAKEIESDMPVPRTLIGAWKEMRETWHRQQSDPDYEFDTPVPEKRENAGEGRSADDALVNSIGDLAPKSTTLVLND